MVKKNWSIAQEGGKECGQLELRTGKRATGLNHPTPLLFLLPGDNHTPYEVKGLVNSTGTK